MKRRGVPVVIAALLLMATPAGVAAEQLFAAKKDPYRNLFAPRVQHPQLRPTPSPIERATPAKPQVVCGMVMVPANPSVDPKIRVKLPDNGVRFILRAVTPTICKPE